MKKIFYFLIIIVLAASSSSALAQDYPPDQYVRGEVIEILESGEISLGGSPTPYQKMRVRIDEGKLSNSVVEVEQGVEFSIGQADLLSVGQTAVLIGIQEGDESRYYIIDQYRLPQLGLIFGIFFILVVLVAGRKGFGSIVGLGVSLAIITLFIIPQIIAGTNPLLVSLIGASLIGIVSILVAHGPERRTYVALASTLITLILAIFIAWIAVILTKLTGMGSENAFFLQSGNLANLDLRGLLLGGMVIGALGVLDDVTTSQAAAVEEIYKADPNVSKTELYRRSMSVGREHIAALVNTLALAYVGAAFPLFLLIAINTTQPFWVMINGQMIVEEIVRTLAGSMSLVLAVPITTLLAIKFFHKKVVNTECLPK